MRVGTYPTRNFATLGPLLLRPPFTRASVISFAGLTNFFNLLALGRRQPPYIVLRLAETCVFDKQLLGSGYCSLKKALLLPKLRSYFAEFLRESYLAPLSILYLPTCVGYGTGINLFLTVRAFLGSMT